MDNYKEVLEAVLAELKQGLQTGPKALRVKVERAVSMAQMALGQDSFDVQIKANSISYMPPPLPDKCDIKPYQDRTDAYEHLRENWGQWLKFFNPKLDRDYLYQYQLKELDPALLTALRNQIARGVKSELKGKKASDIVPSKRDEIDFKIYSSKDDEIKQANQLVNAVNRRKHKPGYMLPG